MLALPKETANGKPQPQRPGAAILAGALCAAIDASLYAEDYAKSKGLQLKLTADDIRAMAISLYIDARKETR